ncbi:amino acid ABC transporter substrate-binding protein [Flavihumibacter profundi]|uniref:amino acid ABC transporter substrate-binding protein n=1 Tax=Flavihumibacter profundi TaxID=2716883 RepID=UPI001CC70913|nr:amino acid ABC transporter substrate-binding protein [Flavihumibacter profundi]MBZ5859191.1 amino acid ABC transporter substrate-binding protein [Flavihumibacter profundi]
MRFIIRFFLIAGILLISARQSLFAQQGNTTAGQKSVISVLLPLYLDSAFDATGQYRYGKQFPKYMLPGLEFYEGAQLAIDSLKKENVSLDIHIIDTRSGKSINEIIALPEVQQSSLVLGFVSNNEIRPLATFANSKQVPFINVNLPNDGGVTNNPYMVILNSSLATHCEGIYKFLQRNYSTGRIVVFRKAGAQEDRLKGYLTEVEKSTMGTSLKLKYVTLPADFKPEDLTPFLDSLKITLCVAGSLDEQFARNLCTQLAEINKNYPVQVMGMPTWDGIREFDRKEYKDLDIFYSTPFNPVRTDALSEMINTYFKDNLYARPSDMVFRGYESMYRFGKLLRELGPNFASGIGEKKYKVFTDFDIQPVLLDKQKQQLDYFENKKLYIIKKVNGVVSTVF